MAQSDAPIPPPQQDEFISNSDALALVRAGGFSATTFYRWASKGLIPKRLAFGRQRGAEYSRPAILRLLEKRVVRATRQEQGLRGVTDWISFADLPFVQSLDLKLFEHTVDMAITWQWWQRNPRMCRILYNASDRRDIWGAVTVMPLVEETLFRLLRHEMEERDIKPEDILPYEGGNEYSCYVTSLLIRPEHRVHLRTLLQSLFDYWCEQYPQIKISRLYADVTSEQGMYVVHHLFFSPLYDFPDTAFELRPLRAGNPSSLVSQFQRCIRQKEGGVPAH